MGNNITIMGGDLFTSDRQTIVNTINCVGAMGKGIALEFKKRYPDMYERYRVLCKSGLITVGKLWIYKTDSKWILNFPTKDHWRYPSKLEYLEAGLKKFVSTYEEKGITSIAFPLLGTLNGGLDKKVVLDLMCSYLCGISIPVDIYDQSLVMNSYEI